MLRGEYRVAGNQYSVILTSKYQLCVNFGMIDKFGEDTITSQRLMFAWCHNTRLEIKVTNDNVVVIDQRLLSSGLCLQNMK